MKATLTDGRGKVFLADVPKPELGDYTCLCKTLACATCSGTDQKIVAGALPWKQDYPGILGHESVGRVIQVGKKVRHIKEGDLFLRPTAAYPGEKLGDFFSLWGGFAEYGLVTDTKALLEDQPDARPNGYCVYQQQIPADVKVSPADVTMVITLKECASFMANVGARFNTSLAILGSGPVAASMAFFAKLHGVNPVIVIGRRDAPLAQIRKLGVDFVINNQREDMLAKTREYTDGRGVDLVVDCAGDLALITESAALLASKGRLAPYAVGHEFKYQVDRTKGPATWDFVFAGPSEELAHPYLMDLVRRNLVPLREFYSHRFPFPQFVEGFDLLRTKEATKIVFEMES